MWSNISAPKSHLKAAHVGQQTASPAGGENNNASPISQENQKPTGGGGGGGPQRQTGGSPLMRYKHAACASQTSGLIYIHGGRFGNGLQLDDDVWRFDPHENAWLQLQTSGRKPPGLQEHTLVEHEARLYLFGGQVSAASGQENSFWRLDLATNEWSSLNLRSSLRFGAHLGPANRRGHSAVLHRHSMYIFGGYEDFRGSTNQLWQYDLLNERWELRNLSSSSACQPEPRHGHSAVVYRDSMFVYGGLSNLKPLADLWRWSWRERRWFRERTRGHSPGRLHGHSSVQAFGSMFVFGGQRQNGRATRSLWRLNLQNLCWQKIRPKGPRPNPTTWHAAIANPMDVLDEANYLIEGEPLEDDEQQQQQQQQQQWRSHHTNNNSTRTANTGDEHRRLNSLSDNCFQLAQPRNTSANKHNHLALAQEERQQTIPMETIRPIRSHGERCDQSMQMRAAAAGADSNSSSCDQHHLAAGGKLRDNSGGKLAKTAKRRLRLNFLRRSKSKQLCSLTGDGGGGGGNKPNKALEFVCRQMPSSWSAANIAAATKSCCSATAAATTTITKENPAELTKRHSISSISKELALKQEPEAPEDVAMQEERWAGLEPASRSARNILDSLDTDIKQMFSERAETSPAANDGDGDNDDDDEREEARANELSRRDRSAASLATDSSLEGEQQAWRRLNGNSGGGGGGGERDSLTHSSQLWSLAAPGSGHTLASQTYQTAREQLTSNSTLTITNAPEPAAQVSDRQQQQRARATTGRLAETRQRRSMHQFNRRHASGSERRARPKSEILQSLIDRADARIKHFYTPLFQPEHRAAGQQRSAQLNQLQFQRQLQSLPPPPPFNSNDPILGDLQNHRMFQRAAASSQRNSSGPSFLAGRDSASGRLAAAGSKRHTIHQTTTYYSLYFGSAADELRAPSSDSPKQPPGDEPDCSGASTIKMALASSGTNNHNHNQTSHSSTTAALVGVRDGTGSGGDSSTPRAGGQSTDASVASSLLASSAGVSRTLRAPARKREGWRTSAHHDDDDDDDGGGLHQNGRQESCSYEDEDEDGSDNESESEIVDEDENGDEHQLDGGGASREFRERMSRTFGCERGQQQQQRQTDQSETGGDNTSLSFSMIAEFEEDDMLQYSSPTEPNILLNRRRSSSEAEFEDGERADSRLMQLDEERGPERRDSRAAGADLRDRSPGGGGGTALLKQQKSTSSGYDSIRSFSGNTLGLNTPGSPHERRHEQAAANCCAPAAGARQGVACQSSTSASASSPPTKTANANTKQYNSSLTADSLRALAQNHHDDDDDDDDGGGFSAASPFAPARRHHSPPNSSSAGPSQASANSQPSAGGPSAASKLAARLFFGKRRQTAATKTRYWQLCMFVMGGKQQAAADSQCPAAGLMNEPLNIWRLYI